MQRRVDRGAVVAITYNRELHPAVVLSDHGDDLVLVIASGTSQHYPELESVRIDSITRAGKSMRLSKPTYFYGRGIKAVAKSKLSQWRDGLGRCPDYEVAKLLTLMSKTLLNDRPAPGAEPNAAATERED